MNTHQFKPGDRVRVGAPTEDNQYGDNDVVNEGAIGVILQHSEEGSCDVQFNMGDPLVDSFGGDFRWNIDPRRLTLVDDKPVTPAAPLSDDGGPAFPTTPVSHRYDPFSPGTGTGCSTGMSIRQYAAIKLCVPESGTPWLDEMIRKSLHDRFAGQALEGMAASEHWAQNFGNKPEYVKAVANAAHDAATVMMERRDEK